MSPSDAGLGTLTPDDWKMVSAAVGKNVGPDASGKIQPLQSLFAFTIADERAAGTLSSGQELTIGDLKGMGNGQTSKGFVSQINNSISYLEQNLETSLGASAGRMVNITTADQVVLVARARARLHRSHGEALALPPGERARQERSSRRAGAGSRS